jgi:hypothetical protein
VLKDEEIKHTVITQAQLELLEKYGIKLSGARGDRMNGDPQYKRGCVFNNKDDHGTRFDSLISL